MSRIQRLEIHVNSRQLERNPACPDFIGNSKRVCDIEEFLWILLLPVLSLLRVLQMNFFSNFANYLRHGFHNRSALVSILLSCIFYLSGLSAQTYTPQSTQRAMVPRSGERYVTDEFGVIRMYVNVWGHVNSPGSYLVYDGIDLATLLSVTGGPKRGANFKSLTLFRETPDDDGNLIYHINMDNFLKTGDRSEFVKILPNDTIIIQQKVMSYVLSQTGLLNTFLSIVNLYYLIQYNSARN